MTPAWRKSGKGHWKEEQKGTESRGRIEIKSPNPRAYPAIYPNYLSADRDCQTAIDSLKFTRRLVNTEALKPFIVGEHLPGPGVQTDDELLDSARNIAQTIYHPTSTCKMGADAMAVVNERLQVHGIEGLRVVDASVKAEATGGAPPTIEASEYKLFTTEFSKVLADASMDLGGPGTQLRVGTEEAPMVGRAESTYRYTVLDTIGGGTSEVQKNIITRRGLGPVSYTHLTLPTILLV